jgi:hypothetical protein
MSREPAPIEDYLDDLLRRGGADPRTTRRLLDEANDHLRSTAADLEEAGMPRIDAEREAVRRFGPAQGMTAGCRWRSFAALVTETARAAVVLGACGLVAVGLSGGVVAVMNAAAGPDFVGGTTVFGTGGSTVGETAHDAVILRALAGVVGLLVLAGMWLLQRRGSPPTVLPRGLADAIGAAAFAAATAVLTAASVDQAVTGTGGHGVGFFLSGALVSFAGTLLYCTRATRALLLRR